MKGIGLSKVAHSSEVGDTNENARILDSVVSHLSGLAARHVWVVILDLTSLPGLTYAISEIEPYSDDVSRS
jgi:hypothetical protein